MATDNQERLKVELNGHVYNFVGNSSLANMKATARLLKQQLRQIKRLSPSISNESASVLLAYNAISNQLKLQNKLDQLKR